MSEHYERLARKYLEAQGLDPDEHVQVQCPDGDMGCCVMHWGPRWLNYVGKAKEQELWLAVLTAERKEQP